MKRLIPLALCLILVCSLALPVSADEVEENVTVPADSEGLLVSSDFVNDPYGHRFVKFLPGDVYCRVFYKGEWNPDTGQILVDDFNLVRDCTTALEICGLDTYPLSTENQATFYVEGQSGSTVHQYCYADAIGGFVYFWGIRYAPADISDPIYVALVEAGRDGSTGYYYILASSDGGNTFYSSNQTACRVSKNTVVEYASNVSYEVELSAPRIEVSCPAMVVKGLYVVPRAELMNPGDISGNILCFLSGQNSPGTYLTETISGTSRFWTLYCGRDETASTLTLTFMVEGRPDICTTYSVSVVDSQTDNEGSSGNLPGSGTATEPPEPTYSGGDDADDFNDNVGDQKDDFDDAMDDLDDMEYPDYGDIDIGFSDILDGDEIYKIKEFFSAIFENNYIKVVFFIAFTLALVSYAFFGKR